MKNIRNRINGQIISKNLRLIDNNGKQIGVVSLERALEIAEDFRLDLVEIRSNVNPPVARLMDYGKFLFNQNKQKSISKKRQKDVKIKEVKFRPNTDIHDYNVKLKNIRNFLESGSNVKIVILFRGRELNYKDLGFNLLKRICFDLNDLCKIDFNPKMEGRQLVLMIGKLN